MPIYRGVRMNQKSDIEGTIKGKDGTYQVDYARAIGKGVAKSINDVARIPMKIAKKVTKEEPSLAGRMNNLIGGKAEAKALGKKVK